ncbi:helix-turn-helix domain-containing protein [Erwinia sp. S43]|uniref:DNA-binding transcriptional regulator RamA n=1 Tax=Pantoea coffeiphila TaxID=1465635 RepID=A0A2S9IDY5_9GAMM|nr:MULTISPECIES: helix-turn-helix domain-containing protein [Erwiniaceae]MBK0032930.1 helix-turn-helix domain-containing protein [Erwinia sp. S43]MCW1873420.1 helix-turn-helix domain-containing protein [Erwinia sp. INIA01]PRD16001.1 DNA-binding transcriptional regulator RamA [Pantoea coffeiphila]
MDFQQETVDDILPWIDEHIGLPLHIQDVAARSGYSKWYFQRLFRQRMNQTLGSYIRERRLYYASQDLALTELTVLDIALRYGFESQQSFTRLFTRYFKAPPARWRRTQR